MSEVLTFDKGTVSSVSDPAGDHPQALIKPPPHPGVTALAPLAATAREYMAGAKAEATKRAYSADWRDFRAWCSLRVFPSLPAAPETVVLYLTELSATRKVSTLVRRLSAISQAHQVAGFESPARSAAVRALMAGIRRQGNGAGRESAGAHRGHSGDAGHASGRAGGNP